MKKSMSQEDGERKSPKKIEQVKNDISNGIRAIPYDFSDEEVESFVDKAVEIFNVLAE